jgi:hypothetical protein
MAPDDEADIFDSGSATPASSDNAVVSSVITDLQHDSGGRSQPADRQAPPAREAPPQTPPDGVEDRSTAGLLKALLDERQTRQNVERERDEAKRWRDEQERTRKAAETPFDQRLFEQPQEAVGGFVDERLQPLQSKIQTMAMDFDFRITRMQHGEVFDQAFKEWYEAVGDTSKPNPALYFHVARAANPGEALIQWYKQASVLRDVGDDPATYRQKIEAEVLARYGISPESLPTAAGGGSRPTDAPRAPNGQFAPRHEVRLPTATARLGRAGSGVSDSAEDGSDEAIFDAGRPSRRK